MVMSPDVAPHSSLENRCGHRPLPPTALCNFQWFLFTRSLLSIVYVAPPPFDREEEQKTWPTGLSPCSSPQSLTSQASQERQVGCRGLGSLGVSLCGGRAMAGALGGTCHIIGRTRKFLQRNLGPVRPQPVPPGGFASCLGFAAAS